MKLNHKINFTKIFSLFRLELTLRKESYFIFDKGDQFLNMKYPRIKYYLLLKTRKDNNYELSFIIPDNHKSLI